MSAFALGRRLSKGEADNERSGAASRAGHGRDVGELVIGAHAFDELVKVESKEMAAALLLAERNDLHVARLDVAKRPVAHGTPRALTPVKSLAAGWGRRVLDARS